MPIEEHVEDYTGNEAKKISIGKSVSPNTEKISYADIVKGKSEQRN